MAILQEARVKEERVRSLAEKQGYQSLLITRRENFSWLSCGGRAVTSYISESSPVYLLVTPTRKYAIGYNMDLPRTLDEELGDQGFEPVSLPTFGKTPEQVAQALAGGRLAADDYVGGLDNLGKAVTALHEPFLPEEIKRYREVAQESAAIVRELAYWVEPGMTERYVLAHMWGKYLEHNFEGDCMFIVSDERIQRYRHAVPCDKKIENIVILAPAVYKRGLHVQISRMVYFKEPSADQRRRYQAVATIQAAMLAGTVPGAKLTDMLQTCLDAFEALGFPEEKTHHWHGGPTGYRVSYPERSRDPEEEVRRNMAFCWYVTVCGAKSEEVILIDEQEARIVSVDAQWPMLQIDHSGKPISVPDLLAR